MTRNYAVSSYGIVLNGRAGDDLLRELADDDRIESYPSFTGEAFPIRDDGSEMWADSEALCDETLYFVPLPRMPRLFSAAYDGMDALVDAARRAYGAVGGLPAIGDARDRIRRIVGTYYG